MSESPFSPTDLLEINKIDLALGKLIANKREAEKAVNDRKVNLKDLTQKLNIVELKLKESQAAYKREEGDIKFQQEKLSDRRKMLSTLGNVKAQLAATREIDSTSKQLAQREESVIKILTEMEPYEKTKKELTEKINIINQELVELEAGILDRLSLIESDKKTRQDERKDVAQRIKPEVLTRYETLLRKYPMDPLAPLKGNNCGGCFVKLVPQMLVRVAKSPIPIQCPGCARMLYLVNSSLDLNSSSEV
ncbi:MAG: hypothetical protein SGJ02_14260 [bacterium]|nr:hypothetical protein [bacterium]